MTQTVNSDLEVLRSTMDGPVYGPADTGYDRARAIWNADIDRHPAVIAQCLSPRDVAAALAFARDRGLEISVRGGAHSYSGTAVGEGGLMINLSALKGVAVNPETERARVGGGATMADMDAATQAHGLAVTGGLISDTGVGGLTLGGGMGWLTRMAGLAIDNLVSAQVVLADGQVVRASETENAELFWALRGGGGNFGVVTEFEYRLHHVGPEVNLGLFFWDMPDGTDALRLIREFIPTLPRRSGALIALAMSAPPAPFVPERYHGRAGHALIVVGFGTAQEHAAAVAPIRDALPPLFEFISPIPYAGLQRMLDEAAPWGIRGYEKALDLDDFSNDVIAVLTEKAAEKTAPLSFMPIFPLNGAFSTVGEDDTAFGGARTPHYGCNINAIAPDAETLALDREWVRRTWEALRPMASNHGGYVNFMADADHGRVRESYGSAKYAKLARIKSRYDPGNVFHRNANIAPG
ncbi:FAD-binding oxidoreductase [Nocardia abscessus]|uniref:FAD-binding oxidoreductase n=1 Tax=Nocardia abscessus TaxID=120957 RepID=UPI0002D3ABD9|nr:FAD-binding oxidoreductase [Nocardia abscessus]MCC3328489.1 FAD-binding oxidoreductase [Nocardia abscessus]